MKKTLTLLGIMLVALVPIKAQLNSFYNWTQPGDKDSLYNLEWQYNDFGNSIQILYYPITITDYRAVHISAQWLYLDSLPSSSGTPSGYLWRTTTGEVRYHSGAPLSASDTTGMWMKKPTGMTSQYIRGDGSLATFPAIPTNTNQLTNGSDFITGNDTASLSNRINQKIGITSNSVGVSRSFSSSTGFQVSASRPSHVSYSIRIACSLSIAGGQSGAVIMEYSANGSTGWTEVSRCENGNTGTLTIGLNTVQTSCFNLTGDIPAGYYVRLRTSNTTGSPTYTYVTGQEIIY